MKRNEFKSLLSSCGLRQIDAAWLLGVHPRTVRSWVWGRLPVPLYASLIVQAYAEGLLPEKWLVRVIPSPPP